MIVAVTGANGFIGQHLVQRFAGAGWEVRAVVRRDFETGDARLTSCFHGASVVVHAAGATRAPTPRGLHESNVLLTARTVEAAQRAGVERFVFISSQAAAGPAPALDMFLDEAAVPEPIEAYGRSKLDAERAVVAAGRLQAVVLRPAAVYGPGDRDFLAMFRLAQRRLAVHPGNRDQWISIVHVTDLANAVLLAAIGGWSPGPRAGDLFFIANEEPVQWRDLFRACAVATGRSLLADIEVPSPVVRGAARLGDVLARATGRAGLLTSEKAALSKPSYWLCSSRRARRVLGWAPAVKLDDGLRETYRWYRERGWL